MDKPNDHTVYEFEGFRLDAAHVMLYRENTEISLSPKTVETLLVLVERRGEILSKEELMSAIWADSFVEESNLSQYLHHLRKALGKRRDGSQFIETLKRRGYRFNGEVRLIDRPVIESPATNEHKFLSPPVSALRSLQVERHGNVLALADWQKDLSPRDQVTFKKPDNTDAPAITPTAPRRWISPLAVFLCVLAITLLAFTAFRTQSESASLDIRSELTFDHLTDGRDVNDATISPNGDYFAYHETDGDKSRMWVQQVGQTTRVEVVPETTKIIGSKMFSSDGQFIYFNAAEKGAQVSSLYRVPTLGGVVTKLVDDIGSTVTISPDGQQMAFARSEKDASRTEILVSNIDGSNLGSVLVGHERSYIWGGVAWSPDGRSIAFGEVDMRNPTARGNCTISAVDPATGSVRDLSPEKWDGCGRMEWTPDGEGLLFIGTKNGDGLTMRRDQLYHLSLKTGEARRLTTDGNRHQVSSLGVTRSGEVLVVPFNRSSQLWVMDASGRSDTAKQITNGQADGRAGIAPLPDGRIGYMARYGDALGIWIANKDGSEVRQIISGSGDMEELRVSADGNYFYFSARVQGGMPRLYRSRTDGSDIEIALNDDSFDVDSSISPDGNWIAYGSSVGEGESVKNTLRLASLSGGNFVQLTNDLSIVPNFSPDGSFVSFIERDAIGIVTVPDGKRVASFKPHESPVLNIGARWTPDGKALLYISRQKLVSNIWMQPLDGSEPSRLTDFTNGEIYNFAFTTDGKKLILARGHLIRNAILVKNLR